MTVVGVGAMGMASAFALLTLDVCSELCLLDARKDMCVGEQLDLMQGLGFYDKPVGGRWCGWDELGGRWCGWEGVGGMGWVVDGVNGMVWVEWFGWDSMDGTVWMGCWG